MFSVLEPLTNCADQTVFDSYGVTDFLKICDVRRKEEENSFYFKELENFSCLSTVGIFNTEKQQKKQILLCMFTCSES